ncbi:MAG: DUF1850 domain-containing protein [Eubacteriales bacterium]|nr:DUF1850 domain-containing protein [Eubacteriales bacterium]
MSIIHNGVTVLSINLPDGESFILRYTHSVNRSPVDDTIERAGCKLIVRSSLFQTFGAGIPVADDIVNGKSTGTSLTKTEKGLLLDGIDTVYPEIGLITGTYSDHRIITDGEEYILKEFTGEKQLIKIRIKRISLFNMIKRELKNVRK